MNRFLQGLRKVTPVILTCLSAIGTVTTAIFAVQETPKAMQLLEEETKEQDEELSLVDKVKVLAPVYWPAAATCVGTMLCSFGACALSWKQQASLASAYALLERTYKQYKDRITGIVGENANRVAEKAVELEDKADDPFSWDENRIFYEEHYKKFFERTMGQVFQAMYMLNNRLASEGEITLNDFLEALKLEPINGGSDLVWTYDTALDQWEYVWADFGCRDYQTDDGMTVCEIVTPFISREEADKLL